MHNVFLKFSCSAAYATNYHIFTLFSIATVSLFSNSYSCYTRNFNVSPNLNFFSASLTKRRMPPKSPPHYGLKLGGYERHQKNLKAQANLEYKQFLEKQVHVRFVMYTLYINVHCTELYFWPLVLLLPASVKRVSLKFFYIYVHCTVH